MPPTAPVERCRWCLDRLSSPFRRRTDGTGLHVACARYVARAAASPPTQPVPVAV